MSFAVWRSKPPFDLDEGAPEQIYQVGGVWVVTSDPQLATVENVTAYLMSSGKTPAWRQIKAERERRTLEGGYRVGQKWYHSDGLSRTQQIGLVLLGGNIPPNTQWKTMDGTFVLMTQQLAGQIFAAAAASDIAIFAAAEQHRLAMEASPDPANYDCSRGWPLAFGE